MRRPSFTSLAAVTVTIKSIAICHSWRSERQVLSRQGTVIDFLHEPVSQLGWPLAHTQIDPFSTIRPLYVLIDCLAALAITFALFRLIAWLRHHRTLQISMRHAACWFTAVIVLLGAYGNAWRARAADRVAIDVLAGKADSAFHYAIWDEPGLWPGRAIAVIASSNEGFNFSPLDRLQALHCYWLDREGWTSLAQLRHLEVVVASPTYDDFVVPPITARAIRIDNASFGKCAFANIHCLTRVELPHCTLSAETLGSLIANNPGIQAISLEETDVEDSALLALPELQQLRRLDLTRTAVTHKTISAISTMPAIRELRLKGTGVGDESIASLGRMSQLEFLEASRRFTAAGIARLRQQLPDCVIAIP